MNCKASNITKVSVSSSIASWNERMVFSTWLFNWAASSGLKDFWRNSHLVCKRSWYWLQILRFCNL